MSLFRIAVDHIDTYEKNKLSVSLTANASTPDGNDVVKLIKSAYENNTGKDLSFQTEKRRVKGVIIDYKATPNYRSKDEDLVIIELVLARVEVEDAPMHSAFDVPLTIRKQREILDKRFEHNIDGMLLPVEEDKPIYHRVAERIANIVEQKDKAYGKSVANSARILKVLYPNGIKPEQYKDVMLIVRILDKMSRIANKKKAFDENPYEDIAGYGIVGAIEES